MMNLQVFSCITHATSIAVMLEAFVAYVFPFGGYQVFFVPGDGFLAHQGKDTAVYCVFLGRYNGLTHKDLRSSVGKNKSAGGMHYHRRQL